MEYDILKIEEETTTVKAEANAVVSHKKLNIQRNGFRRFENGKVVQTSRLGEASLEQLLQESKTYGGPGGNHDFGFAPARSEHRKESFADSSALESFRESVDYLTRKYPDFVFSGQCVVSNKTTSLSSSYGLDLSTAGGKAEWYFVYQQKGSGNMMDGYMFGLSRGASILDSVKEQEMYLLKMDQKAALQSGSYPVLLVEDRDALKKLLESFFVNKYREKAALYSGKLGQDLFHPKVDLIDAGYDPASGQFMFFDGEGTVRGDDLYLIKEGRFNSLISDLRYSHKFDLPTTGNGTRLFNRGVSLDFKGLKFKKRATPWRDIIRDLPVCIVALLAVGGDSNDLGEYSTPVQIGYVFRNGQLEGLAPQVTLKTSVDQLLGNRLIDISSDGFVSDMSSACVIAEMDVLTN